MKFVKLFNDYKPRRKCGIETAIGIGTGAAGLLSSGIGALTADSTNSSQMSFTRAENQKNRDWQSEEAERARRVALEQWFMQFGAQNEQWYKQQNYSQQLWRQQQDYLNAYNSPQEQVKRLKEAGLNPSLAIGDAGNAGGLAPASSTNVSSPSVSPVTPSPVGNSSVNLENPGKYIANGFAQSFNSFANGFKQLITSGPEGEKLAADAKKALSDVLLNEQNVQMLKIKNYILSQTKDKQVEKIFKEVEDLDTGIWLKRMQGSYLSVQEMESYSKIALNKAEEMLSHAKTDYQREMIKYYATDMINKWHYQNQMGSAAQISASAQMVNAQATRDWLEKRGITEDAIRPLLVDSMALQNDLTSWKAKGEKIETFFRQSTVQARISSEIEKAYQMKLITKTEVQNLRKAIADGDWAQIEHMMNALQKISSSYRDIGIGNNANVDAATSILNMPIP